MKPSLIQIDPDIQHGEPVFRNTRVPIKSLFDYIYSGKTIETYLSDFPAVNKEMTSYILKKQNTYFYKLIN